MTYTSKERTKSCELCQLVTDRPTNRLGLHGLKGREVDKTKLSNFTQMSNWICDCFELECDLGTIGLFTSTHPILSTIGQKVITEVPDQSKRR